jgi:23S rRNA (uracil1939-C5)-methyltransferase
MKRAAPTRSRRHGPPQNVFRRADGQRPATPSSSAFVTSRPRVTTDTQGVDCGIKAACGSCQFVNTDYKTGLAQKYQDALKVLRTSGAVEQARLLPPVPAPKPLGYRSLFKLAVRPQSSPKPPTITASGEAVPDRFAIGLYEPGSHKVVPMDDCPLHTPPLRRLLKDLRWELNKSAITAYDEAARTGQLRYLAARSAHLTGEIILTFVLNSSPDAATSTAEKAEFKRLVDVLRRKEHKINSAHVNYNAETGNAIFGATTVRIAGSDRLRERLCDLDFEVGPTSFFQINPWQAVNLYRRVEQMAGLPSADGQATPVAWDLYCGTGQISLMLARAGYRVLGIEENPGAVADAEANARKNKLQDQASFVAARVEDSHDSLPQWAQQPSLIVANPSRRGLAETTRHYLADLLRRNPQSRFVYVSCEVETLARDLKILVESGFVVRQVEPFDMFPQTAKLEWLVVLSATR